MMIELIANLIAVTALGGAFLIVAIVVARAVISLAARASTSSVSVVVSKRVCRYCGVILGEEHKCQNCGAVERA
jgi:hypothetical protein